MDKTEIRYQEADLDGVLQFYANRYDAPEGTQFIKGFDGSNKVEWFVDIEKRRVVFKLYLEAAK
jgi:hypothetical protein